MDRATPDAQLTHIGLYVKNLETMIDFYSNLLGLVVTDSGPYYRGGRIAFLSRKADEHHQLVLAEGRVSDDSPLNQISFRMAELEDLRWFHRRLLAENVPIDRVTNHGNAWSIYCLDPEKNRLELYVVSPWYVSQPFGQKLDLTVSAEQILEDTKQLVMKDPSWMTLEDWSRGMKEKLA